MQTTPAIRLNCASVVRNKHTIWSQGTFEIPEGTISAIVGTNGTGKTTLLEVELGIIPLASGSIEVFGNKAGSNNQIIGYVPQQYGADCDNNVTALQSVLLGLTGTHYGFHFTTKEEQRAAYEALEYADIAQCAHLRLNQLSGGQRQRVAIAQAIVCKPRLLMLDEPLANLDVSSQRLIVDVLARLNRELGTTIEIVSHDLNMLLPILDAAIYLLDGHPHYAPMHEVLDANLLTHLYGTRIEVVTTVQGEMFVSLGGSHRFTHCDMHDAHELTQMHQHNDAYRESKSP